jgi:putative CocE/NonD family hydrolase
MFLNVLESAYKVKTVMKLNLCWLLLFRYSFANGNIFSGIAVSLLLNWVVSISAQELPYVFEKNVMIPMRDGTRLAANIYKPNTDGSFPAILTRTPYGKPGEQWGEAKRYLADGFAMVVQDCRGRGDSEGEWDPFRYDPEDGFDTQEWVGSQDWCNGVIGTSGGSYVGWTQWASVTKGSRYLKTMVPIVPFGNVFNELAYDGGAYQLALLNGWGAAVGGVAMAPEALANAYTFLPLREFGNQFEPKVSYLNDWVEHHRYDDYWKQRGMGYEFSKVKVPVLNIGGWFDIFSKATIDLVDQVRAESTDKMARRNQFVIMGPWAHGPGGRKTGQLDFGESARLDLGKLQMEWFQYWLQDKETGVEDWPPYYLFVMGSNEWRAENEWPLKRTQWTSFYLHSDGAAGNSKSDGLLNTEMPGIESSDVYTYHGDDPVPTTGGNNLVGAPIGPMDQTEVEKRPDVLTYTTAPLEEAIEVTGPVKMTLFAASSARDTDFTAKLVDVHPDGKAFNLCDGIVRARFRDGMDQAKFIEPGSVVEYEIDLWVTSNVFLKDHSIRLEISSSNFPRYDRNPNSGLPFGTDVELHPAHQTIYHDADHPSHLILPVIPLD